MKTNNNYTRSTNKVFFGTDKKTQERIYLQLPDWAWYWSIGWLGNKDCHYHLCTLCTYANGRYINMRDARLICVCTFGNRIFY